MKKIDKESIQNLATIVNQEGKTSNYQEIAIINYINNYENNKSSNNQNETIEENKEEKEEFNNEETSQEQNENNDEKINIEEYSKKMYINMNFLGLDLSKVPTEDLTDLKVLIICKLK